MIRSDGNCLTLHLCFSDSVPAYLGCRNSACLYLGFCDRVVRNLVFVYRIIGYITGSDISCRTEVPASWANTTITPGALVPAPINSTDPIIKGLTYCQTAVCVMVAFLLNKAIRSSRRSCRIGCVEINFILRKVLVRVLIPMD